VWRPKQTQLVNQQCIHNSTSSENNTSNSFSKDATFSVSGSNLLRLKPSQLSKSYRSNEAPNVNGMISQNEQKEAKGKAEPMDITSDGASTKDHSLHNNENGICQACLLLYNARLA
jgi:hypothetical protein